MNIGHIYIVVGYAMAALDKPWLALAAGITAVIYFALRK